MSKNTSPAAYQASVKQRNGQPTRFGAFTGIRYEQSWMGLPSQTRVDRLRGVACSRLELS